MTCSSENVTGLLHPSTAIDSGSLDGVLDPSLDTWSVTIFLFVSNCLLLTGFVLVSLYLADLHFVVWAFVIFFLGLCTCLGGTQMSNPSSAHQDYWKNKIFKNKTNKQKGTNCTSSRTFGSFSSYRAFQLWLHLLYMFLFVFLGFVSHCIVYIPNKFWVNFFYIATWIIWYLVNIKWQFDTWSR